MKIYKGRMQVATLVTAFFLVAGGLVDRRDGVVIAGAILAAAVLLTVGKD